MTQSFCRVRPENNIKILVGLKICKNAAKNVKETSEWIRPEVHVHGWTQLEWLAKTIIEHILPAYLWRQYYLLCGKLNWCIFSLFCLHGRHWNKSAPLFMKLWKPLNEEIQFAYKLKTMHKDKIMNAFIQGENNPTSTLDSAVLVESLNSVHFAFHRFTSMICI